MQGAADEGFIIADREGFLHLRGKIEEILNGADEVIFDEKEFDTDFVGIGAAGIQWQQTSKADDGGGFSTLGCIALFVLMLVVWGLGLWKVTAQSEHR